ncbi:hypothetical protein FH972_027085 [Carpinus fangiana]|uniref:arsenate reductase (glutathione/glutaredoxin) n=1 Tax=Carpinus fangiana TaxID=176857 RepID=A0A5N6L684_9ROSI|nr:hypothetical protein FH972_027085 [Carpinus fangiana]
MARTSGDGALGHRGPGCRRRHRHREDEGLQRGLPVPENSHFAVHGTPDRQARHARARREVARDRTGGRIVCQEGRRGMSATLDIVIYHNPDCGTSRNTLAMIRNAGIEPHVIEYLKTPPARPLLASLIARMGVTVRAMLREKGTPFHELGLGNTSLTDDQLLDAMMAHPILINRPIVVSPLGVRLCRPSEAVLDLVPAPQRGAFTKEDGEKVVDVAGVRLGPA